MISIHAAREGGDKMFPILPLQFVISIHAAREGGDLNCIVKFLHVGLFQSTPPVKAATTSINSSELSVKISIHAAREGGDDVTVDDMIVFHNFNPRRP